jgi:hypothetical protein
MKFILNVANKCFFAKIWSKNQGRNNLCWPFFEDKSTNEMFKSQFETKFHISLIWNIFKLYNIKTMQYVKSHRPTKRYVLIQTIIVHH